jgi:integrase
MAQQIAGRIKTDIEAGYFDPTLLKYRPRVLGKNATEITTVELFQRFSQYKLKECDLSPRSIETRYKPLLRYLERSLNCLAHEVTETKARNFKAILIENLTPQTAKARLWLLQSCWEWGRGKYHVAKDNPWKGLTIGIKGQDPKEPEPFNAAEIQAILGAFRAHRYYAHYADFATFLLNCGTRPGEAAALQWSAISSDFRTAWIGRSYSRGHYGKTKTKKPRTILLNPAVSEMLRDRHARVNPQSNDLVFPSPKGLPICDRGFRNRAWVTILNECRIPYRKPYNMRHSAATHALRNGSNYVDVAGQLGNSKQILLKTYAHEIQSQSIFVEF